MAEKTEVKKKEILKSLARSLSVRTKGGISGKFAKMQDISDYWVDLVFDQLEHDSRMIGRGLKKAGCAFGKWVSVTEPGGLSEAAVRFVGFADTAVNVIGDNLAFQWKRIKDASVALGHLAWENKITVIKYSIAIFLIYICIISAFNYTTGYAYSYNGRDLGYVKEQQDVTKVVDIVSMGLTQEYGVDVQIDPKEDFSFEKVSIVGKTTDTSDDVLRKLTYMQDTKVQAYAIYVDGIKAATVDTEDSANEVIAGVRNSYIDTDDVDNYEKIYFKQDVTVAEVDTTVGKLMSKKTAASILKNGESRMKYAVKLGETVESIAETFGISQERFMEINPDLEEEQGSLKVGGVVNVINKAPKVTLMTEKVVKYKKSISYKVKKVKTDDLYEGDTKVKVKGKKGKKKITARVYEENGKEVKRKILKTKVIEEPVTKVVLVGTKTRPATVGSGHLINPCPAGYQSSSFGMRWGRLHRGVDLACGAGNNIYAADGGTVITAGYNGSYGNYVKINHQNGMVTTYAHASQLCVGVGDKVYQGQIIAKVGNTGNSYGAHCHFEVEVNGSLQNPRNYF